MVIRWIFTYLIFICLFASSNFFFSAHKKSCKTKNIFEFKLNNRLQSNPFSVIIGMPGETELNFLFIQFIDVYNCFLIVDLSNQTLFSGFILVFNVGLYHSVFHFCFLNLVFILLIQMSLFFWNRSSITKRGAAKYIWKQQNCQLNRNSEYFSSSNEKFRWVVKIPNKYSIQRLEETFEFNNSIEHYVNTWNLSINYWICTIFCWKPISDVMHIEVQWNECASSLIHRQKCKCFSHYDFLQHHTYQLCCSIASHHT